jgi:hypothetical protein
MLSVPGILSPDFHTNLAKIPALLNRGVSAVEIWKVHKTKKHTPHTIQKTGGFELRDGGGGDRGSPRQAARTQARGLSPVPHLRRCRLCAYPHALIDGFCGMTACRRVRRGRSPQERLAGVGLSRRQSRIPLPVLLPFLAIAMSCRLAIVMSCLPLSQTHRKPMKRELEIAQRQRDSKSAGNTLAPSLLDASSWKTWTPPTSRGMSSRRCIWVAM